MGVGRIQAAYILRYIYEVKGQTLTIFCSELYKRAIYTRLIRVLSNVQRSLVSKMVTSYRICTSSCHKGLESSA